MPLYLAKGRPFVLVELVLGVVGGRVQVVADEAARRGKLGHLTQGRRAGVPEAHRAVLSKRWSTFRPELSIATQHLKEPITPTLKEDQRS